MRPSSNDSLPSPLRAGIAFGVLALAAIAGFWKPYLTQLAKQPTWIVHLHALLMAVWCSLLVAQPLLLRSGRTDLHRRLGSIAWVLPPLVLACTIPLAVVMTRPASSGAIEPFRYSLFYVQITSTVLFAGCVGLALRHRRDPAMHARWMAASGLGLIDPVFARVFTYLTPSWPWLADYGSMLLTDGVLFALLVCDRARTRSRGVWLGFGAAVLAIQVGSLVIGVWPPWRHLVEAALR